MHVNSEYQKHRIRWTDNHSYSVQILLGSRPRPGSTGSSESQVLPREAEQQRDIVSKNQTIGL